MRCLDTIARTLLTACTLGCAIASAQAAAPQRVWDFRVFLDDSPIGYHRFTLRADGTAREMTSEARFDVKVLVFSAYRYAHDATERWSGDCLTGLNARTDDDGKRLAVDAVREGDRLAVASGTAREVLDGCVMSFAYWNPRILRQSRLLNAQTGEYEAVNVAAIGAESAMVRGTPVAARRFRITGRKFPIDVWYSATDEWLALESVLEGGRRLRYQIEK